MGMTMTQKILAKHAGLEQRNGRSADRGKRWTSRWQTTSPLRSPSTRCEKAGFDKVFDNDEDRAGNGPLCTEQGHQVRRAVPSSAASSAQEVQHRQLLRRGRRWVSSTRCCRKKV